MPGERCSCAVRPSFATARSCCRQPRVRRIRSALSIRCSSPVRVLFHRCAVGSVIANRMVNRSLPPVCGDRAVRPCTIDATRYAARACVRWLRGPRQWWRHLSTPTAPLARSPGYTVTPHPHSQPFWLTLVLRCKGPAAGCGRCGVVMGPSAVALRKRVQRV
jgi:hypothetical protein